MTPRDRNGLAARANACLSKAVPIPGMPLVSFGLAKAGWQSSFDALQKAIDYLTCKAKAKLPFSEDEKTYLIEIYKSFSVGGKNHGIQ